MENKQVPGSKTNQPEKYDSDSSRDRRLSCRFYW